MFKVSTKKLALFFVVLGAAAGVCFVVWHRPSSCIITVSSMDQIREVLHSDILNRVLNVNDVLVLFDLDNTLIEPDAEVASDQWFDACIRFCQAKGLAVQKAVKRVLPLWMDLLHKITMRPVEPQAVTVVSELLTLHVPVIALTARQISLCALTARQLHDVNIEFVMSTLANKSFTFNHKSFCIHFEHGVLLCNGNDKGLAIAQLLDQLCIKPHIIVYIDDKEKHLQSVAKIAQQRGHSFVGLRYSFLDDKVKNFKLDDKSVALLEYN